MAVKMTLVGAMLQLKAGFTGLGPIVNSVVAERLAAEKVVTLQVTAHRLQEAEYKRGAGGCREFDHAHSAICSHCGQTQKV